MLTLLFGPLGLFYSSVAAALAFVFALVLLALLPSPFFLLAFLVSPISIGVSFLTVSRANARAALEAGRHRELVAAVRASGAGKEV